MKRRWEVFIIQHSHIDVGYTHRQEVIEAYQGQFIRQAVEYANAPEQNIRTDKSKFKFTCEGFWAVESFWNKATEEEKKSFIKAVKDGNIEMSAFYLHLAELLNYENLKASIGYASDFCKENNLLLNVAMASDINGFSWTVSQLLSDAGVKYLCTNINTHHGGYPLGEPLKPFYWQTPEGNKILVWNGLPYHRANILGLIPGYQGDENAGIPGLVTNSTGGYMNVEDISIAEQKLTGLLKGLEEKGYPYNIIPFMGSGFYTDNSPATDSYCALIEQWNEKHGDEIILRSATLEEFFKELEKQSEDIPTYKGDWNDWWSDGVASTPFDMALFRNAQRNQKLINMMDSEHQIVDEQRVKDITRNLVIYAEHTWGHSHSRETDLIVGQTFARKSKYAIEADEIACRAIDDILRANGESEFSVNKKYEYTVINPLNKKVKAPVYLELYAWDVPKLKNEFCVVDDNGKVYEHQLFDSLRNVNICVIMELEAKEKKDLYIVLDKKEKTTEYNCVDETFSNGYYEMKWNKEQGVYSLVDKETNNQILDSKEDGLGAPVYQLFKDGNRWAIGGYNFQERIPQQSQIFKGRIKEIKKLEDGPVLIKIEIVYEVEGAISYCVDYMLFRELPQIYMNVKLIKTNEMEPEGLYAAFPFCVENGTWYADKAGIFIRPGIDQIPGTCTDYYLVGDGVVLNNDKLAVSLSLLDAPMVHFNKLNLWDYSNNRVPKGGVFSWLTNNKWETNFKCMCGGSYSFRYVLEFGGHMAKDNQMFDKCRDNNFELLVVRK